jgi:O-antigen ligase
LLSKFSLRSISFAHISLPIVGLMWALPFLYFHHAYPITTFYQEWGAALLSLCAMPLLVTKRYWQQPEIPRIVLLPVGMMMLLLLQYFMGKLLSFDQTLLFTLYLLWFALLVLLGQRLRFELGLPLVATVLAVFLTLGAELNAVAGIIQHYRWHTFLDTVVTVKTSAAVYGNIAQPNHFANYLSLGLASIGLLQMRWSLRIWQTALLVTPLLFVLVLSGSRSTWFYLLFMVALAFFWQRRDKAFLPLLKYAALLLAGFALMQLVVQIPWLAGSSGSVTTVERMFGDETGSGGIRLYLWKEALLIFAKYPFLGAGVGQYAWQHFQMGAQLQDLRIVGLYNNAHNLVMQMAAETGLAGLAIFFGTLGLWLRQVWVAQRTIYHWWGYSILAVLGIHSLLEYPLWYGYFIGVAAVALGLMENKFYRLELRNLGRISLGMMLLLGVLSLAQLYQGYKKLEVTLAMRPLSSVDAGYAQRLRESLVAVHQYTLLRPYAELFMTGMIDVSPDHLADKMMLNERSMRFIPIAPVVYRHASLLAMADRLPEAKLQLHQALWSYPAEFRGALTGLQQMAHKDPAHFSALLEFATQKNEEYQRAVLAK